MNQEIYEGLRTALARGYPLESAMMSFFNAGYKKEEIEEAARALYQHPPTGQVPIKPKPAEPEEHKPAEPEKLKVPTKPLPSTVKPSTEPAKPGEKPVDQAKADVSKYEEKTKPKGKLLTILLILFLFILVSSLIGIFVFREELIRFFANTFG